MIQVSMSSSQQVIEQAAVQFQLASVWWRKGKLERAIAGYREVLRLQPTHLQATVYLDDALKQQNREALHYQKVSQAYLGSNLSENPNGKISLVHQKVFSSHRCGWSYAIRGLQPLHNSSGILFDGFLENSFFWKHYQPNQIKAPYTQPWVGFLHNPPAMPNWFYSQHSPQALFAKAEWQQSLKHCLGLFCLSNYHADWVRQYTNKPVSVLIHPTEIPERLFDFDRFVENSQKKIVQLGWWLRKLTAIYQLPIHRQNALGYEKIKLNPAFASNAKAQLEKLEEIERKVSGISSDCHFVTNTREVNHLPDKAYDQLLSENIGFIALHDTSVNNAVIECIARTTPLLVNPLPAVIEYLGKDYPMYFQTLTEAAQKAQDLELIKATHEYLKTCETRKKLSAEHFCQSFQASEVYQKIVL
ncbi:MAG: tetratricopeptide repeat protein [Phormidesmis sp.]